LTRSPPANPLTADEDGPHPDAVAQFIRVLAILRRRWLVVFITTGLCVAGAALALHMLKPKWKASATIVLHTSGAQVLDKVQGVTEDSADRIAGYKEYYQTQRTIMRSRAVGQRALAKLGLALDPEFLGTDHIRDPEDQARASAEIDPLERLRELVAVEEVRNSRVVEISATYTDPIIAAEIANAVSDAYIEYVRSGRSQVGEDAKDNIASERDKALVRLRSAEEELERFKSENNITSLSLSDRQNIITQDILTLSGRTKESEAERIRLERILAHAQALHESGNLAVSNLLPDEKRETFEDMRKEELLAEAEFRSVDIEFGPKHAEHRKAKDRLDLIAGRIGREASDLIDSLASRTEAAREIEQELQRSLQRENNKALRLASLERRYRELERESHAAADDYLVVRRRDTEIALTNQVEDEGIDVLDRATPPGEPFFPPKVMVIIMGILAGLGLGTLFALSIDLRDQRLRGLLDLERGLASFGIPVLGQLPLLSPDTRLGIGNARAQRRQRDLYAHVFPQSLMAERCRGIRTSIAFVQGEATAKTIMVTSPSSSEGKSSTAMNLALSFCQAGKNVLVADADMRRPRLHQVFEGMLPKSQLGLAAVLTGQTELDAALVRPTEGAPDGLWLLPCGDIPENPAELLDSAALRQTLAALRERFDVVVVDSPPILAVADPLILAGQVDGVVLVTRCEQTTRGELQRALTSLAQSDANMLGVVLNQVDARHDAYGYRGGYYTYRATDPGSPPS